MAKLTRVETARHEKACALIAEDRILTADESIFVAESWHEGASHLNTRASAHFTPWEYAEHAAIEADAPRVLDLCAGIGTLSLAVAQHRAARNEGDHITMVEINPDYAAVARRILPQAEVIVGSVFDKGLTAELAARDFDIVMSNPPFGTFASRDHPETPRYTGRDLHYAVIDIAADLATYGVFVLPQNACPFRYSGRQSLLWLKPDQNPAYDKFTKETGISLEMNCGIDTADLPAFRGVNITTEIALADFRD